MMTTDEKEQAIRECFDMIMMVAEGDTAMINRVSEQVSAEYNDIMNK
jgi:hypothetical protein